MKHRPTPLRVLLPLLALVAAAACGDEGPAPTDQFDGTWVLSIVGDCEGSTASLEIEGGLIEGTLSIDMGRCESGPLRGAVTPDADDPNPAFPALGDIRMTADGPSLNIRLRGEITDLAGSGVWFLSDESATGVFQLTPAP